MEVGWTVAGVVAALGALLAWVAARTRRPVDRPPSGPVHVPEASEARGRADALDEQAGALRETEGAAADEAREAAERVDPTDAEAVASLMNGGES